MKTNDGGPAFPVMHSIDGNWNREPFKEYMGMTLRDWFAGQALAGMVSPPGWADNSVSPEITGARRYAKQAYMLADAMLAARETKKED